MKQRYKSAERRIAEYQEEHMRIVPPISKKKRTHCELCGKKLERPENNFSRTAVCKKCMKGQMEIYDERGKEKPWSKY